MQLSAVSWKQVSFSNGFWEMRREVNRAVTLPIEHEQCRKTGRFDAFKLDWQEGKPNQPHHFWDSDVAKWIEAVGYSLATHPDAELERKCDAVIDLLAAAQQADGYLNVFYTVVQAGKRWTNLRDMHELYCAGHLMEAAVAYFQGTGKRKLLEVMCRYADHIGSVFGPGEGQKPGYCGHPEIELALVKLYRATGNQRYLDLARFFVLARGQSPSYFQTEAAERGEANKKPWAGLEYYQADAPLLEQKTLEGHAVRALYLLSGAVDVAAESGDRALLIACKRLWRNVIQKRMYVTGAAGSARHGERFTFDYDLPNETAYAETCANIALALVAHRLLKAEADGEYGDVMERALYNGVASGVSLSGDRFFYANALTVDQEALTTEHEHISAMRKEWFGCSCCPPNIARIYAWLGEMVYSTGKNALYVHLYASGEAKMEVGGKPLVVTQATNYPWDGKVRLTIGVGSPTRFALALRIPGWCGQAKIRVNGKVARPVMKRGYAYLSRMWAKGDQITLDLPMEVQFIETNPACRNNIGKIAVQRGPIVYCAEEIDNGPNLAALRLSADQRLRAKYEAKLLGGVVTLSGTAQLPDQAKWGGALYRPAKRPRMRRVPLKLVPYCVWGNRKVGKMQVWFAAE